MDPIAIDREVLAAQGGDREAFRRLVIDLQRDVRLFIAAHAHDPDLVEEVLQQSFVTAYEQLARYELRGTFTAWVKGIARNVLRREFQERRRLVALPSGGFEQLLANVAEESLETAPEEFLASLRRCLDDLPAQSRRLLERRYGEQVPLPALAQRFKRTKANLSLILHRLRATVRDCLVAKGVRP